MNPMTEINLTMMVYPVNRQPIFQTLGK